jgi:hypothetical protein
MLELRSQYKITATVHLYYTTTTTLLQMIQQHAAVVMCMIALYNTHQPRCLDA